MTKNRNHRVRSLGTKGRWQWWRQLSLLAKGLLTTAIIGASALSFNLVATSPSGAAGTISPWLAMDGNIQFTSNGTNSFGWANENTGSSSCGSVSDVNVPGTHGLFNCGSPNADPTLQANAPANANGDGSILGQSFLTDPYDTQVTPGCTHDLTTFHGGQKFGDSSSYTIPRTGKADPNTKDDLTNAYYVSRVQQSGEPSPGDKELYFGVERLGNNGDVAADIEFLQGGASITGTCSGTLNTPRTQGDFAIEFNFVNGGTVPAPVLDLWQCTGTNTGNPAVGTSCDPGSTTYPNAGYVAQTTIPAGVIELAENTGTGGFPGDIPCGGWVCGSGTTVNADEFVEGGIDLSALGLGGTCTGNFLAESHESQSNTSNLTDFVGPGPVTLCSPTTTTTTPVKPTDQTVGNTWSDSVTVQGNQAFGSPTGTVQFYSCDPTVVATNSGTCSNTVGTPLGSPVGLTTGGGNASTASSIGLTPNAPGTWCFAGYYSGEPGSYLASADDSTDECFVVNPATPDFETTVTAPTDPIVGAMWNDSATLTGNTTAGTPTGTVTFTFCQETSVGTPCTGGNTVGVLSTPTSTTNDSSTWTLPGADAQTPGNVGTYCYNAAYTATSGGNYASVAQQTDDECFPVLPAPSSTATQQSSTTSGSGAIVIGPMGTVTDTATVTGNPTGLVPTGTVTFFECGPTTSAQLCPAGTQVGSPVSLTASGSDTATATSSAFMPSQVGTYCFAAVYAPSSGSNYVGSTDNMSGNIEATECFLTNPATPTLVTTVSAPTSTTVGNSWGDSAAVTGVTGAGAPAGSVAFTFCQETTVGTACAGGNTIGTVSPATSTSGLVSTYTLPPSDAQSPATAGTYCFNASYSAASGGNYVSVATQSDSECFAVTAVAAAQNTAATPNASTPSSSSTPGTIAFTGADLTLMVEAGVTLLALGGFLVLVARRRRAMREAG